jgi:hypothetical protein
VRAIVATVVFTIALIAAFLLVPQPWAARLPNAVFYAVLVLNTFYSVRYFDAQPPQDRDERVIDTLLAVDYLALAAAIGAPLWFALLSALLFALSIGKYVLLLPVLDHPQPLHRKIRINSLGLAVCLATALGVWLVDPLRSAWAQAILFAAANVYLLWINPLYADRR